MVAVRELRISPKTCRFWCQRCCDDRRRNQQSARGVILLPMTAGGIVLAYNLPGVQQLKLPRDVYTGMFLGTIKTWNDPKITAANPGVNLPNQPITIIHRSDGSGTTGAFTQHLSAIGQIGRLKLVVEKLSDWYSRSWCAKK